MAALELGIAVVQAGLTATTVTAAAVDPTLTISSV